MKLKKRSIFAICCTFLLCSGPFAEAQPGPGGWRPDLERAGIKPGMALPDLTVYDASGNPFQLTELKGSTSVLVFGCLT